MKINNERSFTLLELLITTSIFVIVAVTSFSAFHTGLFGYRDIDRNIKVSLAAAQILGRMDMDIRNSIKYSDSDLKFEGSSASLSFVTLLDQYAGDKMVRNLAFVSYGAANGRVQRLCRSSAESLNAKSTVKPDEMGGDTNTYQLSFRYGYLDDTTKKIVFKNAWDPKAEKSLPKFVNIALKIGDKDGKLKKDFARMVFLPAA